MSDYEIGIDAGTDIDLTVVESKNWYHYFRDGVYVGAATKKDIPIFDREESDE